MSDTTATTKNTKDSIRSAVLGAKPSSEVIEVFGIKMEIRQPSLGSVLDNEQTTDRKEAATDMLIRYAYVPGTDDRIFDEADRDGLLGVPFGSDFQKIQNTITKMLGVVVTEDTKSLAEEVTGNVDGDDDLSGAG